MAEVGGCAIGTAMGRYYAMDRSKNWALTSEAFECLVDAKGKRFATVEEAVKTAYDTEKTPDGDPMTDEYIPCSVIGDYAGIQDGDSVMHTNYRQDRAIQLTQAFVCDDYAGVRPRRPKVTYLGFTRYWDEFQDYLLGAMGGDGRLQGRHPPAPPGRDAEVPPRHQLLQRQEHQALSRRGSGGGAQPL